MVLFLHRPGQVVLARVLFVVRRQVLRVEVISRLYHVSPVSHVDHFYFLNQLETVAVFVTIVVYGRGCLSKVYATFDSVKAC